MELARTARACNSNIEPRLNFLIAARRRWDNYEYRLLRLRLAFSGQISDKEAVLNLRALCLQRERAMSEQLTDFPPAINGRNDS